MKYEKGSFITVPNKSYLDELNGNELGIYLWLCAYANEEGECFPSRSVLSKNIKVSKDTLDKVLKKLVDIGLISKESRYQENEQTSNLYQIIVLPSRKRKTGVAVNERHPQPCMEDTELNTINSIQLTKYIRGVANTEIATPQEMPVAVAPMSSAANQLVTPTLNEVGLKMWERIQEKTYWLQEGMENEIILAEAEKFLDYYNNNGWKVGGNRMKDWRLTVNSWLARWAESKKKYTWQLEKWQQEDIDAKKGIGYTDAEIIKHFNLKSL
jgi:hypothetical protein